MEETLASNLIATVKKYKSRFLLASLTVLISNSLTIANPLIFRQAVLAIDPAINSEKETLSSALRLLFQQYYHSLLPWVLLLVGISIVSAYLKYKMRMEFMMISREVETELRGQLFKRIQEQSRVFFDNHGIGELLSRLTNDVMAYRDLLGFGIMYPVFFITLVLPGLFALFLISVPLALLTLIPIILVPIINLLFRGTIYGTSLEVQKALAEMSNRAQEDYAGIRIVKGYGITREMFELFKSLCRRFTQLNFKLSCWQGVIFPLFSLVSKLITLALVLLAGYLIHHQLSQLNVADFLSFIWVQSYIFFPVLMLGWLIPIYERGRAAYARLVEIYKEPIEVQNSPTSKLKIADDDDIEFKNLTFYYPNSPQPALKALNLTIKHGSFIGITGPVGSGKSTLFHLLNREYEIPHGTLFIGEHEIQEYSLEQIHKAIVTVEQTSFLFSRTVADNVRFGREEASQQELETASEFADLHETVMSFPERYETIVGERGVTLSGGQKQRVALARAFLVKRSIFLLDDIFSAVDTATEKKIFQAINDHFRGKTVLIITHRVSILEQLDRIIYLSQGEVLEQGTPEELKQQKGHYAALVELQKLRGDHESL